VRRICLTLPTNRACGAAIWAIAEEAAFAATRFGVEVYLLILDSSDEATVAAHRDLIARTPSAPDVVVVHLDEAAQRDFLDRVIRTAEVARPELIAELMLPADVSYGACTNRAFLIGSALGCESVHRRDSDSRYQVLNGAVVFPIEHELASLGRRAAEVADVVSEVALDARYADRTVVMAGASFVGELSVDVGEIRELDPGVYYDLVSLWAADGTSDEDKRQLVAESFTGAGTAPFTADHSTLTVVDPMRVDMCNVSFHGVHEEVPLPPACNTIGSDYFLLHLVHDTGLPGVLHNRHIVNFHTAERKSGAGFLAYHLRLAKFFLSMQYFHDIYGQLAALGDSLLDGQQRVSAERLATVVRDSTWVSDDANVARLESLDRSYRRLGGKFAGFADMLAARGEQLLAEARRDIEDYALLIDAWAPLVMASKTIGAPWSRQPAAVHV
jgi:hypothetical protein